MVELQPVNEAASEGQYWSFHPSLRPDMALRWYQVSNSCYQRVSWIRTASGETKPPALIRPTATRALRLAEEGDGSRQ